jgi:hypothetical protein
VQQPWQVHTEINSNPQAKDKTEKLHSGCIAEIFNLMANLAKACVISSD